MGRVENAEVFRDTERMCRENARLREAIAASRKGQRLILEGTSVGAVGRNRYAEAAFRTIEFAVYCRPGDTANYDAFAAAFR